MQEEAFDAPDCDDTPVVDRAGALSEEEWLAARRELLKQEKQLTKQQQCVAAARRELPWVKVTRGAEYVMAPCVFLDVTPKGRNETQHGNLTDWVRPHDRYDVPGSASPVGPFMAQGGCCHEA